MVKGATEVWCSSSEYLSLAVVVTSPLTMLAIAWGLEMEMHFFEIRSILKRGIYIHTLLNWVRFRGTSKFTKVGIMMHGLYRAYALEGITPHFSIDKD